MAFTSRLGLRATSALRMSAARWSGRTSASAPFTLPMGVRQASTTNTELTLSYLSTFVPVSHHKTQGGGAGFPGTAGLACGDYPVDEGVSGLAAGGLTGRRAATGPLRRLLPDRDTTGRPACNLPRRGYVS